MLINEEIKKNEIVKVLVNVEDVEEEMYAIVEDNRGDHLELKYLELQEKIYKGASIYSFSEEIDIIRFESITEHHSEVYDVADIDMMKVADNMYVFLDEVDIEEARDIISLEDDSSYTEDSFVVADDYIDGEVVEKPHDAETVDKSWKEWTPMSPGARRFKETIDMIEFYVKQQHDENAFK